MLHVRLCSALVFESLALFIGSLLLIFGGCSSLFLLWTEISLWFAKYCIPSCKIQMQSWEVWQLRRTVALNKNAASALHFLDFNTPPLKKILFPDQILQMALLPATEQKCIMKSNLTIWITAQTHEGITEFQKLNWAAKDPTPTKETNLPLIHSSSHIME